MTCHALWIGPALGAVERACLRSVLRQGHDLTLWCYEPVAGVPEGIKVGAADEIVPRARIIRHRSGSPALFANLFRYTLQRRGLGTWLDCDAYLLKPLDLARPYLICEEEPGLLAIGILRMPADSPLLPPLLDIFEERDVPVWLPFRARLAAHARRLATGRTGLSKMPWGSAGPKAISALVKRLGVDIDPLPPPVFHPVHWRDADWIFEPGQRLEDKIAPETVSIHLWNQCVRHRKDAPAPPGSFLARLQEEGRA